MRIEKLGVVTLLGLSLFISGCSEEERPQYPKPTDLPSLTPFPTETSSTAPSTPTPSRFPKLDSKPERLKISKLGIDLPVQDGEGLAPIPEGIAWRLKGSAPLGTGSNAFIYAHARLGSFLNLWDAQLGDDIQVSFVDGSLASYRVSLIAPLVVATDLRWMAATTDERITLQTSTGSEPDLPKFIVVALRTK